MSRDLITAKRLLASLEITANETISSELGFHRALKLATTLNHIKSLLDGIEEPASGWASSSRTDDIRRGSVTDLKQRAQRIEGSILAIQTANPRRTVSKTENEFEFLTPAFPADPIIPLPPIVVEPSLELLEDSTTEELDSNDTSPLLDLPVDPPQLRSRNGNSTTTAIPSATSNDSVLQHHHSLQSSLVDSLSTMSSQLKQNSIKFSAALEKDKEVIESAQDKLGGNLGRMKKEGGRLSGYEKTSRSSTWFVIMAVSGVAIAWIMMFLLIKVS